jgi:hypothetical protein
VTTGLFDRVNFLYQNFKACTDHVLENMVLSSDDSNEEFHFLFLSKDMNSFQFPSNMREFLSIPFEEDPEDPEDPRDNTPNP